MFRIRGMTVDVEPLLDETVEEPLSAEEKLLFQVCSIILVVFVKLINSATLFF